MKNTANTDKIIDMLLKKTPLEPSVCFTDRAISAIADLKLADAVTEAKIDNLLKKPCGIEAPRLADAVIAAISMQKGGKFQTFMSWVTGSAVAACAALAIFWSAPGSNSAGIPSYSDYAQMSDIADEISALSVLLAQEEYMDILNL